MDFKTSREYRDFLLLSFSTPLSGVYSRIPSIIQIVSSIYNDLKKYLRKAFVYKRCCQIFKDTLDISADFEVTVAMYTFRM